MIRQRDGFTLIELLIVIALIAVMAGAVIIALNPGRQFSLARDSQRWSHVSVVANAIQQKIAENRGTWSCAAGALPTTSTEMTVSGGYDICGCLVPNNIASLPFDPSTGSYTDCTDYASDYTVERNATTGRITVRATPEIATEIYVTQ